jgi:hypothetical protein
MQDLNQHEYEHIAIAIRTKCDIQRAAKQLLYQGPIRATLPVGDEASLLGIESFAPRPPVFNANAFSLERSVPQRTLKYNLIV